MTRSVPHTRDYKDATEIPGAIVIEPQLDPAMSYDPKTKRTIDRQTGNYFASAFQNPINRIYQGSIRNKSGEVLQCYEYRYGGSRLPSGHEKSVYEIIWSIRGPDYINLKVAGGHESAKLRAQHDSLERLASFLRAQSIGYYDGDEKGEVVLVDRRMDDLRREMR